MELGQHFSSEGFFFFRKENIVEETLNLETLDTIDGERLKEIKKFGHT